MDDERVEHHRRPLDDHSRSYRADSTLMIGGALRLTTPSRLAEGAFALTFNGRPITDAQFARLCGGILQVLQEWMVGA